MLSLIWSRDSYFYPTPFSCNLCYILCDLDSTFPRISCQSFTFHFTTCIHLLLMLALGHKPNEFEPTNALNTFSLTLRGYIHERTINLKLAFRVTTLTVRVVCTIFHPREGAALQPILKKNLVKICNGSTLGFDTRQWNLAGAGCSPLLA